MIFWVGGQKKLGRKYSTEQKKNKEKKLHKKQRKIKNERILEVKIDNVDDPLMQIRLLFFRCC